MSKKESVIKRLAQSSIRQHRMQNRLSGIVIMIAAFLLSFSIIFVANAAIGMSKVSGFPQEAMLTIIGVMIIIICAVRVVVSSILYASAMQRTQEYATLQLIGTTQQQISQIICEEERRTAMRYIPIGLVFGIFVDVILPVEHYWAADIAVVLLAGIFIRLTVKAAFRKPLKIAAAVSPIEATKPTLLQQVPRKYKPRNRRLTAPNLAIGYIGFDRKKSCYTFCSLILSGILMFSVFSIVQAIDVEKLASYSFSEGSSLYVEHNADYLTPENDYSYHDLMKNSPFTEQLRMEFEAIPGISKIYQLKSLDAKVVNPDTGEHYETCSIESILNAVSFSEKIVDGELPIYLPEQEAIPVVVNRASLTYEEWKMDLNTGDTLTTFIDTGNEMTETTLRISGFIEDRNAGIVLFTDGDYLDHISEMNCDIIWYITTEKGSEKAVADMVSDLVRQDDRMSLSILENVIDSYKTIFHNAFFIIAAFVILISSFSIINLVNTCISNTLSRQYDYVLLEAIGMTKKQLFQMQFVETAFFLFGGFIGSCVIGIPIGAWLCREIANLTGIFYIAYSFPVMFIGLYLLASCIVFILLLVWQQHTSKKLSVVERLKSFGR